jgi:hypothetical protein
MKFHLAINMERIDDSVDMRDVAKHTLEMVQMAERGGFEVAWAAEHHALEMTIAPNPFQILTWWGENTDRIRLGTAVAVAAYWHPVRLAGEAAMTDLLTGGRVWNSGSDPVPISANSTVCAPASNSRTAGATCRKCCQSCVRYGRATTSIRGNIGPSRRAETAATAASETLDGGAGADHLRFRGEARHQYHFLAVDPANVGGGAL